MTKLYKLMVDMSERWSDICDDCGFGYLDCVCNMDDDEIGRNALKRGEELTVTIRHLLRLLRFDQAYLLASTGDGIDENHPHHDRLMASLEIMRSVDSYLSSVILPDDEWPDVTVKTIQ